MERLLTLVKNMEKTKKHIRQEVFKRRRDAEKQQIVEHSHQITERVVLLSQFQKADWIYLYVDCKNEVMTQELFELSIKMGKHVAVPRVEGKEMCFYEIHSYEELEAGYFGILEPITSCEKADGYQGLMIMPGVAFDSKKHRVGYGGGFYDRYLAKYSQLYKVAIAFDFQIFQDVPMEETDILPDVIITETNVFN